MADSYRVEVSANNRAGCQDALCKKEKIKILKGEIRFGVFVSGSANGHEFAGFKWRHWGCVSGKTIEHIRNQLQKFGDGTNFNWDYLDGLEEMPSDYKEKIKTAIIEGKIADEDWNGDPEYNVLGKLGIRSRASAKKNQEDEEKNDENAHVEAPSKPPTTPSKSPTKKRRRAMREDEGEDEQEETKPAKRRTTKVKKEEEESDFESKPARKPRAKRGAKNQKSDDESSIKEESQEMEVEAEPKPTKQSRAKKGAKKEQDAGLTGEGNGTNAKTKPASRARTRAAKKEEAEDQSGAEADTNDVVNTDDKPVKRSRGRKAKNQKDKEATDMVGMKEKETEKFNANAKPSTQNPLSDEVEQLKEGTNDIKQTARLLSPFNENHAFGNCVAIPLWLDDIPDSWEPHIPVATPEEEKRRRQFIENTKPFDHFDRIAMAVENTYPHLDQERKDLAKAGKIPFNGWVAFLMVKFQKLVDDGELPDDIETCSLTFLNKLRDREMEALNSWADRFADEVDQDAKDAREAEAARKAEVVRKAETRREAETVRKAKAERAGPKNVESEE